MRAHGDDGSLAFQVFDGGDRGADTSIIGDLLSVKRNVDIATDEDLLSLKVGFREIFDGFLGIEGEVDGGGTNGAESEGRSGGGEGRGVSDDGEDKGGVEELPMDGDDEEEDVR